VGCDGAGAARAAAGCVEKRLKGISMDKHACAIGLKVIAAAVVTLGFSINLLWAQVTKEFPAHWGTPPGIQTQDYVELPAGYGHGSSTPANSIAANPARDKSPPRT